MARAYAATQHFRATATVSMANPSARSILVVAKRTTPPNPGAEKMMVSGTDSSGIAYWNFAQDATTDLMKYIGLSNTVAPTMTFVVADGWCLVAMTKASGTTTPRFHKVVLATGVATHENAGSATADNTPSGTGSVLVGRGTASATTFWTGSVAMVGIYGRELSDSEVESAARSVSIATSLNPNRGFWLFDGNGTGVNSLFTASVLQTDTGTVDVDGQVIGYGHPVLLQ